MSDVKIGDWVVVNERSRLHAGTRGILNRVFNEPEGQTWEIWVDGDRTDTLTLYDFKFSPLCPVNRQQLSFF